jgi:hypothetical protein
MTMSRADRCRFDQRDHDLSGKRNEPRSDEFLGRSRHPARHPRSAGIERNDPEDVDAKLVVHLGRFEGTGSDYHREDGRL